VREDFPLERRKVTGSAAQGNELCVGRGRQGQLHLEALHDELLKLISRDHFRITCGVDRCYCVERLTGNPMWRVRPGERVDLRRGVPIPIAGGDIILLYSGARDGQPDGPGSLGTLFWNFYDAQESAVNMGTRDALVPTGPTYIESQDINFAAVQLPSSLHSRKQAPSPARQAPSPARPLTDLVEHPRTEMLWNGHVSDGHGSRKQAPSPARLLADVAEPATTEVLRNGRVQESLPAEVAGSYARAAPRSRQVSSAGMLDVPLPFGLADWRTVDSQDELAGGPVSFDDVKNLRPDDHFASSGFNWR